MADRELLLTALAPILERLSEVDVSDPAASADLNRSLALDGQALRDVCAQVVAGLEKGWLTPRGGAGMTYGRLTKATAESRGFSIDVVHMDRPGPEHTHPQGEFDLCFALDGDPTFDGHPPGWVVMPPGSRHVPTVAGGDMAILYFLPGGAIEFHKS